jgi:hypothetical protein
MFKLILIVVLIFWATSFIAHIALVLLAQPDKHEEVRTLINACSDAWKGASAAILGLLAGKSI